MQRRSNHEPVSRPGISLQIPAETCAKPLGYAANEKFRRRLTVPHDDAYETGQPMTDQETITATCQAKLALIEADALVVQAQRALQGRHVHGEALAETAVSLRRKVDRILLLLGRDRLLGEYQQSGQR